LSVKIPPKMDPKAALNRVRLMNNY
jgi:hypothetical protein